MPRPKGSQNKINTEKKYEDEPIFIEGFDRGDG